MLPSDRDLSISQYLSNDNKLWDVDDAVTVRVHPVHLTKVEQWQAADPGINGLGL